MSNDRPRSNMDTLMALLDERKGEIGQLLPKGVEPETFISVCKTAAMRNPKLADADRRSLFTACLDAARDGLLPDGKEAVLNIYPTKTKENGREVWVDKVQYLPMVGGMVKKLYATGVITFIDAAAVYECDFFDYARGDDPHLIHKPTMADEPGKIVAAYAVIRMANGEVKREVMPARDIKKVRESSKAADGPGWKKWEDQFAIKSVIKRAWKQLPHNDDMAAFIERDNEVMGFESIEAQEAPKAEPAEPLALPLYSQEAFNSNFSIWEKLIKSGKRTADEVTAMVSSSYTLSEEQHQKIHNVKKEPA